MATHNTWFVPRCKRNLTALVDVLVAFSDVVEGNVWPGNTELQLRFEDEIARRGLRNTGNLRARNTNTGGGGIRTYFAQLKALGLVFLEEGTNKARLTISGEELLRGVQSFVDIMRYQLVRFQYPSNSFIKGSSKVSERFHIHPFWFLLKLLTVDELGHYLSSDELMKIVILQAENDSDECFRFIVSRILAYRNQGDSMLGYTLEEMGCKITRNASGSQRSNSFYDIVNTFTNYLSSTLYVTYTEGRLSIVPTKMEEVKTLIQTPIPFIGNIENHESFQRRYGCDRFHTRDRRVFDDTERNTPRVLNENRMRREFVSLAMEQPIRHITPEIITIIAMRTAINEPDVERFLHFAFPRGGLEGFWARYREMAFAGRDEATEFERATATLFRELFGFNAEHVGPQGNTPDVYIESAESEYCAIIDNKAYRAYSITGDHFRRMKDVYIPRYQHQRYPLAFFTYIAGGFCRTINNQISNLADETGISGCAIDVDTLIEFAERYEINRYNHETIRRLLSVNRSVSLQDLNEAH